MGKKVKKTQESGREESAEPVADKEREPQDDAEAGKEESKKNGGSANAVPVPPQSLQVFVSGLPYETNEEQLRHFFDQ